MSTTAIRVPIMDSPSASSPCLRSLLVNTLCIPTSMRLRILRRLVRGRRAATRRTAADQRAPSGTAVGARRGHNRTLNLPTRREGKLFDFDEGVELKLATEGPHAPDDLEAGRRIMVDVAVAIEAPGSVDSVEVPGRSDGISHRVALVRDSAGAVELRGGALDSLDGHPSRLRRVEGEGG